MNPAQMVEIGQALLDGKTVQYKTPVKIDWNDLEGTVDDLGYIDRYEWRIKPTLKLRAWKPEEVPVGAWIRPIDIRFKHHITLIFSITNYGIQLPDSDTCKIIQKDFKFYLDMAEHSTDNGKTWQPCGVLE